MAAARSLNLLTVHKTLLPYVMILLTLACGFLAPIPSANIWSKGYLTIYGPFLLLGSMFYLCEQKQIRFVLFALFTALVFYQYFRLIATYQTAWLDAHFAILAFLVFLAAWASLRRITYAAPLVLLLSDLTYAVYLFHNWLFEYAKRVLARLNIAIVNPDIQALIVLLVVCFLMVKYVEKPFIRLGRTLLRDRKAQSGT